ncbi:nucleotidyltransferase domain-containing protein (plasmid) [Halorientalis pallida]|uniref:nucleotidyltransferase domain-containing protein n=1 Tax=Halorientalis pallida TaxID=2479928 RepID=UPI003C703E3A
MSLGEREDELLDTLEAVIDAELPYVLVGGWAIAAFNQRFTTDVDVVIPAQAVDDYTSLLAERGYEKTADVERNDLYEGRTVRYEKDIGNPVQFDAMVDALGCRQTEAEWSYRYLAENAVTRKLRTGRPITAQIPERELLFAVKLHSGRKADSRDLVVLATDADFDRIATHLHRGNLEKLADRIDTVLDRLTSDGFEDAFKGVFEQEAVPEGDIEAVVEFLRDQRRRIDSEQ